MLTRGDWTFSPQVFGNWTFGTLVFTAMVFTVTLKVPSLSACASSRHGQPPGDPDRGLPGSSPRCYRVLGPEGRAQKYAAGEEGNSTAFSVKGLELDCFSVASGPHYSQSTV